MKPFKPRSIRSEGRLKSDAWTIKRYSIVEGREACDWDRFQEGLMDALSHLPVPARTDARPGVGFVIAHQAQAMDYIVLCWWDQENELNCKVQVKESGDDSEWRAARDGESFCVWDLEVIWFEREAYVATYLESEVEDPEAEYIGRTLPDKVIEDENAVPNAPNPTSGL